MVEVVCVRARVPGERGVVCAFDVYESALDLLRVVFFELLAGTVVLADCENMRSRQNHTIPVCNKAVGARKPNA